MRKTEGKGLSHSCCAPCSSYVLEYLSQYFKITVYYYNPNIYPPSEYGERAEEVKRLLRELPAKNEISFVAGEYRPEQFYEAVRGHEEDPEGGERCGICFELRLREAARLAGEGGFDYFATTLTISPLKDAATGLGRSWGRSTGSTIWPQTSRRKTVINAPPSCPESTVCTARTTVGVCSP